MSSLNNTRIPTPTWFGFEPKLVRRYLEFARAYQSTARQHHHKDLVYSLAHRENDRTHYMGEVSRMKATAHSLKRDLAAVEAQLIDLSDDSIIDETLQAIEKLPFVIGLRPDSHGRLVVFCRLFTTDHDAEGAITGDRHIGDFELTLKVAESDCSYLGVCLNLPARVREVISSTKGLYCHRE